MSKSKLSTIAVEPVDITKLQSLPASTHLPK